MCFRVVIFSACLIAVFAPVAPPQTPGADKLGNYELAPIWEKSVGDTMGAVSISSDGGFIAAETSQKIIAMERSGTTLWEVQLKRISPYLKGGPVAIASGGKWLLIAGDSTYKYVWKIGAQGPQWSFGTHGTPYSLAVSGKGDLIAVGTGAHTVQLLSTTGKQLHNVDAGNWIIDRLAFTPQDGLIVKGTFATGVLSQNGAFKWLQTTRWTEIDANRDLTLFAARAYAMHGPPGTEIGLLADDGRSLWTRRLWYGELLISPDGRFAVSSGISMQMNTVWPEYPDPAPVTIVDPSGNVLKERSVPYHQLLFITGNSQIITILLRDRKTGKAKLTGFNQDLTPVWQVSNVPWNDRQIIYHPSGLLIIFEGSVMRAYDLSRESGK